MNRNEWMKLSILVSGLIFLVLTHVMFGFGNTHVPVGKNFWMVGMAWFMAGVNVVIKVFRGCFNCPDDYK